MPFYCFVCDKCSTRSEVIRPMSKSGLPCECENCLVPMRRDFKAEGVNAGTIEYATPLVSDSLAVNVSQIDDHRKQFPDIEMTREGQPVFTNSKQHDDYLKKTGFVKLPKKRKKRERKVKCQTP